MTIRAIDVHDPANRIDVATIVRTEWQDGTKSYFAMRIEQVADYRDVARAANARVDIVSEREAVDQVWIGIKCAIGPGVAAWGHARIEAVQ